MMGSEHVTPVSGTKSPSMHVNRLQPLDQQGYPESAIPYKDNTVT